MSMVESLEQRRMLDAAPAAVEAPPDPLAGGAPGADVTGPRLLGFRILGSPFGVTGVRLEFDEPLAPGRARGPDNYAFRGEFNRRDVGEEPLSEIIDPFDPEPAIVPTRFDETPVYSAEYEADSRFVTVRPRHRFILAHLRTLHIRSGPGGLSDLSGNFFDGDDDGQAGGTGVVRVRINLGRTVTYFDADRDRVRLRVRRGPGTLYVLRRITFGGEGRRAGDAVQVWLNGQSTPNTVFSGTVRPSPRGGDGRTTIGEIVRPEEAQMPLLSDPAFTVGAVTP